MSQDDIVFGEVSYREPRRMRRPDRDRKFAVAAVDVPGPGELPIFLDRETADTIERHALRDTSVELGGILLGFECVDDETGEPFVWVTQSLEAKHYENTQASFTYTHDSWGEITRERDEKHPDLDIVGWYHTHPDFGIFLSSHDLFIHRNFFDQPLQVAYVVDPIRQTRGFFQWKDGGLTQVRGFFLSADRGDRVALARLVNDLEQIPNADGGSGGISPRLEAELIQMLSRPQAYYAPSPADRANNAVLYGLIGALVGVLGVMGATWFNALATQVRDQSKTLESVQKSLEDSDLAHRMTIEALIAKSSNPGKDPADPFVAGYQKLIKDGDDLRQTLAMRENEKNVLAKANVELDRINKGLRESYEKALKEIKENESAAKRLAEIEKEKAVGATATKATSTLDDQTYRTLWYSAIAGWVMSALLGVGCLYLWAGQIGEPGEPPGTVSFKPSHPADDEPPVQIN